MKRVLFVDDEINVLNGLKRMLRTVARDWSMSFSQSADEALEAMRKFPDFDVVVTDLNMAGMNGADFLLTVRDEFPSTVRFVLTGTTDSQLILKVSNVAHQILGKPCEPQRLYNAVSRAFALRNQLNAGPMKETLHQMGRLPALPVIYQRVLQEMVREDASVSEIGKLIEQDAAISAKVLQIVNSAYMGLRNPISNLLQACSMLGLANLKNVVLMAEVFDMPVGKKLPPGFSLESLWSHCLAVGEAARNIAREETSDRQIIDRAFTAGLLHEVGQLILATQLTDAFGRAIQLADERPMALADAEREVLGVTHAQIGSYLLELWGLPDPVIEAIAFHLGPSGAPPEDYSLLEPGRALDEAAPFTALTAVHMANCFCEDSDASIAVKVAPDSAYLERLGFADRIDTWQDCCKPSAV
ncbi:MAG: HDOD domain-containing protein [Candidatus Hydrogenedentes bacterium]|nr:HDOD domain-containing protein [Candidatus Hydrogenedentota bacterium]